MLSSGKDFNKNFLDSKHVLKVYFKPSRKNQDFLFLPLQSKPRSMKNDHLSKSQEKRLQGTVQRGITTLLRNSRLINSNAFFPQSLLLLFHLFSSLSLDLLLAMGIFLKTD